MLSVTASLLGFAVALLGVLVLLGWITGLRVLSSIRPEYIPMPMETAVLFIICGGYLFFAAHMQDRKIIRTFTVVFSFIALYGLLKFIEFFLQADLTFTNYLFPVSKQGGGFPIGRMSPFTGALFFLSAVAILLSIHGKGRLKLLNTIGCLGVIVSVAGFVVALGYLFDAPLLYGSAATPLALTTAGAFMLLGSSLVALSTEKSIILSPFSGDTPIAQLMRNVLPMVVIAIVFTGVLDYKLRIISQVNPAAISALLTLGFVMVINIAMIRISSGISQNIEKKEAQRKLLENQISDALEFNQKVLMASTVGISTYNLSGQCISANEAIAQMIGTTVEGIISQNFHHLRSWKEAGILKAAEISLAQGIRQQLEGDFVSSFGKHVCLDLQLVPFQSKGEKHLLLLAIDITERKRAEEALRKSQELLLQVVKHDPYAVAVHDLNMCYIAASDRWLRDYNVKQSDIIGKSHYEVFPEIPQRWKEIHQRCLAGAIERNDDDYFERPDGSVTYNRWEMRPWYQLDGKIGGVISYTEVITERKLAEQARKSVIERYNLATLAAGIGVWDWDIQKDHLIWDARMFELYGIKKEDFCGVHAHWLKSIHPDDKNFAVEELQQALRGEKEYDTEFRIIWPDGTVRHIKAYAQTVRDPQGKPLRQTGVNYDITDRVKAQEAQKKSGDRLEKINSYLLGFGSDHRANIDRLVALTGELLQATCALYNRLENNLLCSLGQWHTPAGFKARDNPDGHICYDVIREVKDDVIVICDLPATKYFESDPNVRAYGLRTYMGCPVKCEGRSIGSLCVVYQTDYRPSDDDRRILGIIASAVGNEDAQMQAEDALRESEQRFATVFRASPIACSLTRLSDGKFLDVNDKFLQLFAMSREAVIGSNPLALNMWVHLEQRERMVEALRAHGRVDAFETQFRMKDGQIKDVILSAEVVDLATERYILGLTVDITDRKKGETALIASELRYRRLFESAEDGILLINAETGVIEDVNPFLINLLGYPRQDLLGKHLWDMVFFGNNIRSLEVFKKLREKGFVRYDNLPLQTADGKTILVEFVSNVYSVDHTRVIQCNVRDITQKKELEGNLEYLSHYDVLTGLPNRELFFARASAGLALSKRDKKYCAILFVDLDNSKSINDTMGHSMGDELLKDTSIKLKECVREMDTLARLGGDEFIIFMGDLDNGESAGYVAERIREKFNIPRLIAGNDIFVTASIGIAIFPDDGKEMEDLLKNADTAMYSAKNNGKNTYSFFNQEMNRLAVKKMHIERGLRQALANADFRLFYQPIISVETGKIRGFEALLRWFPTEGEPIYPDEFIPTAEENGLIVPIGEWVLHEACRFNKKLIDGYGGRPVVSVNVSVEQLRRKDFLDVIRSAINKCGLPPECLELEITETLMIESFDTAIAILKDIRSLGVQISLDDFGKGYSSLIHLRQLPIGHLKIDRFFIKDIDKETEGGILIPAIVDLAHKLQLRVVAEGVETELQLKKLSKNGCDFFQGYFFSKAVPEDQAIALYMNEASVGKP